jgi:hypothetical protein
MRTCLAVVLTLCLAPAASADPLLPAPAGGGDATLAELGRGFQRQQDVFATAENGLSLDIVINPDDVALVQSFFAQAQSDDFAQVTGRHPFSVVQTFGEWGDEGNFAGVASVGVAARLMVLRRDGAPAAELARARDAAVRAARAWHVYAAIGGPGIVARGIRRLRPENPADPALPGTLPELTPLTDASGNPLPEPKGDAWRAPVASGFDDWIWLDNTSKDQVSGYALAAVWLWDALKDDPAVPAEVTADLAADLAAFAKALMQPAPELGIDLCIRDADGRLTGFHALNPREITEGFVVPEDKPQNGFLAALALAIIRGAYHVSGDPDLGRYYYEELVAARDLPGKIPQNSGVIFLGTATNYSNVNMMAIAYATLGRVETDPAVRAAIEDALEHAFWDAGDVHDVSHVKQAWYDAVYAAFAPTADPAAVADRIRESLSGYQPAPAFERDRLNCDDAEIAAGSCLAVDGTTVITLAAGQGHGGGVVATAPLPLSIRPDTDFAWRSDPFSVNGTGSSLMDPRGDWLAAYWFARLADRDPAKNLSPNARPPLGQPALDGGLGAGSGGGGGGCVVAHRRSATSPAAGLAVALLAALARRRRR